MCGITGFWGLGQQWAAEQMTAIAKGMADTLTHRGPDDEGVWCDSAAGIVLAHRRLSIIDTSVAGHQPMISADGRHVIVFNGEIYNFKELRQELESAGHIFRSHCDTEVVLESVSRWGCVDAARRFIGMFAFALWDRHTRTLFLVRDRMGEKPLYCSQVGGHLIFGSELKAVIAHPSVPRNTDRDVLTLLLRYGYIPAPYSIYQGVFKVLPGHMLTIRQDGGNFRIENTEYWSACEAAEKGEQDPIRDGEESVISQFEALLKDAVGRQMIADVPIGVFLSGGVDSSTIVALAQAQSRTPVKTFTAGLMEEGLSEAHFAHRIARHLGTDHTHIQIRSADLLASIPEIVHMYYEPFADSSQVATYLVAKLARQHVAVCLSGDGGDEILGGYSRYQKGRKLMNLLRGIPLPLRRGMASPITFVPPDMWDGIGRFLDRTVRSTGVPLNLSEKALRLADVLRARDGRDLLNAMVTWWHSSERVVLNSMTPSSVFSLPVVPQVSDPVDLMMYCDMVSYLPDDILVKVDRATMAVSLESRMPYLDHRLVELAWRIPMAMKLRDGVGKWILRRILQKYVPESLFERPKRGFCLPIDLWLRTSLRDWAESLLDETLLRNQGILDPAPIRKKWREHLSGRHDWKNPLWHVLMLQAWLQQSTDIEARQRNERVNRPVWIGS